MREGSRCRQCRIGFRCVLPLEAVRRASSECADRILRGGAIRFWRAATAPVGSGRGGHIFGVREGSRETRADLDQGQRRNEQHGVQAPRNY